MAGGTGDDHYIVDDILDTIVELTSQGDDSIHSSVSYTLAAGVSVETMTTMYEAGTTAIEFTGNELGQSIYGNDGANRLNGGAGSDYLVGLGGNDFLNGGSGLEFPDTVAKAAALPNIDTVITGHANTTMKMADVKEYADFNRAFLDHVRAAKKAGQSVEEAIKWTVPERFLKSGYNQPMPDALRSNAQVIWNELK